ncbi:MAG: M1 family metallopeptidase [Acidobacteria bacterium]|nr:M1 family metallopeptidase [Acidobacteriota bacterium]
MKTRLLRHSIWIALTAAAPLFALDAPRKLVDYDIRVTLDPATKTLTGAQTLKWTNPAPEPVSELRFHLYWNAFRNNRSTFFKESGGQLRDDQADTEGGWGRIDLTKVQIGGADVLARGRFDSPDDGNPDDRTVWVLPLETPVGPGETVTLTMDWISKVPKVYARAGYVRDYFFIGQWFPKIGVYEPAGMRRRKTSGWNCHQYHANSEFYANFGDYHVSITVPEKFVVASAGTWTGETKQGDKKTLRYELANVHDFAWAADPRFVVSESVWDPARDLPAAEIERAARTLGRSKEDLLRGMRPVKISVYGQPDHKPQLHRYHDAQKWSLTWLGLWAFPYPYEHISIVDPPEDGIGSGGMEYQTLYTGGTSRFFNSGPLVGMKFLEVVTVHEYGHGYWYGMVASNEFEESWMDEGINTFTEWEIVDRRWKYDLEFPLGLGFSTRGVMVPSVAKKQEPDPIVQSSWGYVSGGSYGNNSYFRSGAVIEQMRRLMGEERFFRGLRAYAERWRYDHPTSEDFFDAILSQAEEPAIIRGLIDQTFYGRGFFDVRVSSASTTRAEDFVGFDDTRKAVGFDETAGKKKSRDPDDKGRRFVSAVRVIRDGEIGVPTDVLLTFENGQTLTRPLAAGNRWLRLVVESSSKLARVEVDPAHKLLLDRNPMNNLKRLEADRSPSAARKVSTYLKHGLDIVLSSLWSAF